MKSVVVWLLLFVVVGIGIVGAAEYADFDEDGKVDFADFVQFAQRYGSAAGDGVYVEKFDINGDGRIDFGDYSLFAEVFGQPVHADKVPISADEAEKLAKTYREAGKYSKAVENFQYFVEHARTPQARARGWREIGETYVLSGDVASAKSAFKEVLNRYRHSDLPAVKHQVVWSSIELGQLQESASATVLYLEYAKSLIPR